MQMHISEDRDYSAHLMPVCSEGQAYSECPLEDSAAHLVSSTHSPHLAALLAGSGLSEVYSEVSAHLEEPLDYTEAA